MEILNKKERTSAFLLFLGMFAICMAVLIAALFFNYKLPMKENEVLRNENELMAKQLGYQQKFSDEFKNITKLLDSMQKTPERAPYIEQNISQKLGDLTKEIPDDTLSTKLFERIIVNVQDLVNSKKEIVQYQDCKNTIDQLTQENKEKQKQIEDLIIDIKVANAKSQ
jgi:cell shape-determining protein MreC